MKKLTGTGYTITQIVTAQYAKIKIGTNIPGILYELRNEITQNLQKTTFFYRQL